MKPLDVGRHIGAWANGKRWAEGTENGNIHIWAEFDNPNRIDKPGVTMFRKEWDRIVAWVEWQRKDMRFSKGDG